MNRLLIYFIFVMSIFLLVGVANTEASYYKGRSHHDYRGGKFRPYYKGGYYHHQPYYGQYRHHGFFKKDYYAKRLYYYGYYGNHHKGHYYH